MSDEAVAVVEDVEDPEKIREPIKEKPFPGDKGTGEPVDPRQAKIDAMNSRYSEHRAQEIEEGLAADPGAAQRQGALDDAQTLANSTAEAEPSEAADTSESESNVEVPEVPEASGTPAESNSFADFVEMQDGAPVMRVTVDGREKFVAMKDVRATIQKNEAVDERFRSASEWHADLQKREQAVQHAERHLQESTATPSQIPPLPEPSDAERLDIKQRSKDLVSSMFSGTEEEAAVAMADTLAAVAGSAPAAPKIDSAKIVEEARQAARDTIRQESEAATLATAYREFSTEYNDVLADERALAFVDTWVDKLEKADPTRSPRDIMMEAGQEARRYFLPEKPSAPEASSTPASTDRHANKQKLRPIPKTRTAVQAKVEAPRPETAKEALMAIRLARNQPV